MPVKLLQKIQRYFYYKECFKIRSDLKINGWGKPFPFCNGPSEEDTLDKFRDICCAECPYYSSLSRRLRLDKFYKRDGKKLAKIT